MTAEIIAFPQKPPQITINRQMTGWEYLQLCKKHLITEDYIDVLLAILDEKYYFEAEEPLRDIVDTYFQLERELVKR